MTHRGVSVIQGLNTSPFYFTSIFATPAEQLCYARTGLVVWQKSEECSTYNKIPI